MTDVFVSYATEDRARVRPLIQLLEAQGWTVWWDREIQPGERFDSIIQNALLDSRCVVVVWSEDSVKSEWVMDEATAGKERGVLVPVSLDAVRIPLPFIRTQSADFTHWRAGQITEEVQRFLNAVAAQLDQEPPDIEALAAPGRRRRFRRNLLIGLVTVAVAVGTVFALRNVDFARLLTDRAPNSITVHQFADLTPTHDQQWVGSGIVSVVRIRMAQAGLQVVGSADYAQIEVRRTAQSEYFMQGTVRRIGNRITVTVELFSTDEETQLWSALYERTARADAAEQSEIAYEIVDAVARHILEGGAPTLVRQQVPDEPDAGALGGLLGLEPAFPSLDETPQFPVLEEANDE
jgi:TolB-like protein